MEKTDGLIGCFARLVMKGKWTKKSLRKLAEVFIQLGGQLRDNRSEEH